MVSINIMEELAIYSLDGKWNDYIGVQKEVISVLKKRGYFDVDSVTNDETGMVIRLTAKGIKETIGKGKRFQNLPKHVKQQKIATIRSLPQLIKEGRLLQDNVENYHSATGETFAYFMSGVLIDNMTYVVRIAVKKKCNSNHFYIHHIDMKKDSKLLSPSQRTEVTRF